MPNTTPPLRVLAWGTYDLSKPRVRILLRSLREVGTEVTECHADVWGQTIDKSQVKGWMDRLQFLLRWLLAYPRLLWCWFRKPTPDVVVVGYLGQIDVLILWPFAKLRRTPIVWDAFLSLYNTVIEDRKMFSPKHPVAWALYALEWLACRAADRVVLDTRAHAHYFVERFKIPVEKTDSVFVGAEDDKFQALERSRDPQQPFTVLFYGQFIPLHGIPTIIKAARLLKHEEIRWVLIGKGQEEALVRSMLDEEPLDQLEWIPWVNYEELINWIGRADVCLGIFDDGEKASRVIPNKVFQVLSAGKPLITRDSSAIRELLEEDEKSVWLVSPDAPNDLARAISNIRNQTLPRTGLHKHLIEKFSIPAIGNSLANILNLASAAQKTHR